MNKPKSWTKDFAFQGQVTFPKNYTVDQVRRLAALAGK